LFVAGSGAPKAGEKVITYKKQSFIKMKIIYLLVIGIGSITMPMAAAQDWMKMMNEPAINFYTVQKEFQKAFSEKEKEYLKARERQGFIARLFSNKEENEEEENKIGEGWLRFKRWEYLMSPRVFPTGNRIPSTNAWDEFYKYRDNYSATSVLGNWKLVGPDSDVSGGRGRINCIRFDPTNSNIIYAGAPSGGLWKSVNGGASWTTQTDQLPVIGVTDIAIDPANTQILYLGTGDDDHSDTHSIGVLKSTDGGVSWNTTGLNWTVDQLARIGRVIVNPNNTSLVLAASKTGIYRTIDAGATWTKVQTGSFRDMEFKPGDPDIIYACTPNEFYRSVDGGASWTKISSGLPPSTGPGRLVIGTTPADPEYVYVLAYGSSIGQFYGLYRSKDSGISFTEQSNSSLNPIGKGQGTYDLAIAVSPINKNEVIIGGVLLSRSTDGGVSWVRNDGNNYVDVHDLAFLPGSNTYFACTDGSIFITYDSGINWAKTCTGIQVAQVYRFSAAVTGSRIISGRQDNGTKHFDGNNWISEYGGDGGECIIDYANDNIMYSSTQYGGISKTTDQGVTWKTIVSSGGTGVNSSGSWITPYIMHPTDHNTLLVGKSEIYRSNNGGSTWSQLGPISAGMLVHLVYASSDPAYIYTGTYAKFFVSKNGGLSFTDRTNGLPVSSAAISDIGVSASNPAHVWVVFSGYKSAEKIYESTDAGLTWKNISFGLPNFPTNCFVYQKGSNDGIYVGMDIGVYYKDGQTAWVPFFSGLPNVYISELEIQYSSGKIRAATYGRGVWESDLYGPNSIHTSGNTTTKNSLILSPNPNQGHFNVLFENKEKDGYTLEITNTLGQTIYSENLIAPDFRYSKQFDITTFQKGVYFLRLKNKKGELLTKKIIYY
jgi:photosystem II stability/assembly factor-like uncharacterized protein